MPYFHPSLYYHGIPNHFQASNHLQLFGLLHYHFSIIQNNFCDCTCAMFRRQSRSFGDIDQTQFQEIIKLTKQQSLEKKIQHQRTTETLEDSGFKEILLGVKSEDTLPKPDPPFTSQFTMVDEDDLHNNLSPTQNPLSGSIILQELPEQPQATNLQQSLYLNDPHLQQGKNSQNLQESEILNQSLTLDQILPPSDDPSRIRLSYLPTVRGNLIAQLRRLSFIPLFDPLQPHFQTHLKLKCDKKTKLKTVSILGATLGRSEENTITFMDLTRISARHAKIRYSPRPSPASGLAFHLIDLGSKGGTFLKVTRHFVLQMGMTLYIGRKFAFKVCQLNEETGLLMVKYDFEGVAKQKQIQVRRSNRYSIGRDISKNNFTLLHSACNELLSARHLELYYDVHPEAGNLCFMIDDLESRNGTWLRLSDKQKLSEPCELHKGAVFSLSFEAQFEVTEIADI